MLGGLDDYGSDDGSDSESSQVHGVSKGVKSRPAQATVALPSASSSTFTSALHLPPPTGKLSSRKRDGPVKIRIESLKSTDDDIDSRLPEPPIKKSKTDSSSSKGAGSSSLVSMLSKLPAPKVEVPASKPARMLGGGLASGEDHGISTGSDYGSEEYSPYPLTTSSLTTEDVSPSTSFTPMSLTKPKAKPSVSASDASKPPLPLKNMTPAVDFFSLGQSTHSLFWRGKIFNQSNFFNIRRWASLLIQTIYTLIIYTFCLNIFRTDNPGISTSTSFSR